MHSKLAKLAMLSLAIPLSSCATSGKSASKASPPPVIIEKPRPVPPVQCRQLSDPLPVPDPTPGLSSEDLIVRLTEEYAKLRAPAVRNSERHDSCVQWELEQIK